jgi:hypothetical protein
MKFLLLALLSLNIFAQAPGFEDDEDLNIGGDIFSDFNEDLEAKQVMEDERFYRYSRFVALNIGIGYTGFTGNRGAAYTDAPPTVRIGLMYFMDFQNVFTMGIEYSKHTMIIDTYTYAHSTQIIGAVDVSMLRPYFGFRYYMDTADLGTAITYSNPYFMGRLEYWYQTNTFRDVDNLDDETGGGIGFGVGMGLEFPIELKKTYFNVEFVLHSVNFFDKYTNDYREIPADQVTQGDGPDPDTINLYGFDNLAGLGYTFMFNYVISW